MFVGLSDIYVASFDTDTEEYSDGCLLGEGVKVSIKPKYATGKKYADGRLVKHRSLLLYADLSVETTTVPEDARGVVFDMSETGDKDAWGSNMDGESPWIGIGFCSAEETADGTKYAAVWIKKAKLEEPDETYETEGDKVAFQTSPLKGIAVPLDDGSWRLAALFDSADDAVYWLRVQAGLDIYVSSLEDQAVYGYVYFTFDDYGNLILSYNEDYELAFSLDDDGNLVYEYMTLAEPDMEISDDGYLIYTTASD